MSSSKHLSAVLKMLEKQWPELLASHRTLESLRRDPGSIANLEEARDVLKKIDENIGILNGIRASVVAGLPSESVELIGSDEGDGTGC